jgi:hypothetical protein
VLPANESVTAVTALVCPIGKLPNPGVTGLTGGGGSVTVTQSFPDAGRYVFEPALSGTYVTFTPSVPTASDPPGIKMFALPFTSVTGDDVYPPATCSVTEPVGTGLPFPPLTVAVSVNGSVDATLAIGGPTVTVGVINAVDDTVTVFLPTLLT